MFHYSSKNEPTKLVPLHDDRGLRLMCRFNNDKVDVYVTDGTHITPPRVSTRESNVSAKSTQTLTIVAQFEKHNAHSNRPCTALESEETNQTLQINSQVFEVTCMTFSSVVDGFHIEMGQIFESPV
ncbi:hypothetical protein F0562_007295 [Nyssa sinensis]|uniref:Uncharacterized protein n=1 Tax=Nyssa sinensis TaxID=561372 RepID=A0A5J5A625_9ASTE|nr:hypothetical protein F0562_007295 [Nyssa sinensis]